MKQILEGSRAIALAIKNIRPAVISAYPITPQTHIVEDLAKFKADNEADYEYVRAESEFAAASIVLGASATGVRAYTATSSQGLLLMTEVLFNIAGMRLPIVLTCANRAIGAPINIWNDQQDAVTVRDSGWIMFYAENHQEAVEQHILAFKIAEKIKIPVMINVDGFVLTHTYEPVEIPSAKDIKRFLPEYRPTKGEYLDIRNPVSLGGVAFPSHYMEIREKMHLDIMESLGEINHEYKEYKRIFDKKSDKKIIYDSGTIEYYGPARPKTILVAMGSVVGTIKDVADETKTGKSLFPNNSGVGVLKIRCLRPFPAEEIIKFLSLAKHVAVIDKSISLGLAGTLAAEIRSVAQGRIKTKIQSFIVGLGGRDVTKRIIQQIIKDCEKKSSGETRFVGKA